MEKLILQRNEEDYYRLEYNDKGDYIEIDTTDLGWIERLMEGTEKAAEEDEQYTKEVNEIIDRKDLTDLEKAKMLIKREKEYFKTMNKLFDSFLGEGITEKILEGKKSYGMHKRLIEALQPHFENIVIQKRKAKTNLANRYINRDSDTL